MSSLFEMLKPDFEFSDERGFLCQLVHNGYKQVNVVYSKAGERRGGHYHELNNEAFYVVDGEFDVYLSLNGENEKVSFKKGDMFVIKKNVLHDFEYTQDSILVVLYDVGVEKTDGTKDICRI